MCFIINSTLRLPQNKDSVIICNVTISARKAKYGKIGKAIRERLAETVQDGLEVTSSVPFLKFASSPRSSLCTLRYAMRGRSTNLHLHLYSHGRSTDLGEIKIFQRRQRDHAVWHCGERCRRAFRPFPTDLSQGVLRKRVDADQLTQLVTSCS